MFGRSPRMYDSKVLLMTVAQSKSRLSSSTLSCHGSSVAVDVAVDDSLFRARRACSSTALNRGPRSGQLREGSKGRHLVNEMKSDSS